MTAMDDTAPIGRPVAIDFISDVVCPWCYVGFRALAKACVQRPTIPVSVTMRAFQLDPTTPKEGADHRSRLLAKFGGDQERLKGISKALVEAGLSVDIAFDLDAIKITPNTKDCHRLMRWARSAGVEVECAEALFQAFHVEGEDLSHPGTLIAIARGLGMDGDLVEDLLKSDADLAGVDAELDVARRMGVTGVPCAIFNQSFAVMGAQSVEAYVQALDQAAFAPVSSPSTSTPN